MDDIYPMFEEARPTKVPMVAIEIPVEGRLRVRFYGEGDPDIQAIYRRLEESFEEWELVRQAMEIELIRN